jgi:hypothetical protein
VRGLISTPQIYQCNATKLRWSLAQNRRCLHLAGRGDLSVMVAVKDGHGMREQIRDYI